VPIDLFSPALDDEPEEPTYTVSRLGAEIQELVRATWGSVWVAGELQRLAARASGHRYFELVEKGEGDEIVGKLDAVVWKRDFAQIAPVLARHGQALADGVALRCRVTVDFYPPHGRLQLHVKEIDPVFTLGELARRRQATLAEIERQGLLDANRARPLAELPLAVALVASHGSAAWHDFVATLAESGYGFRVTAIHAAVQGIAAEREVASALAAAAALPVDCVALVRGGGAKSDLAAFDSREIAFAVARCPLPVLTGLGHEIDESVADRVAHRSFKTPTKVAEFLVERLAGAETEVERAALRLARAGRLPLATARARVLAAERRAVVARGRLEVAASRLARLAERLARGGREALRAGALRRLELARGLARAAPRVLERGAREAGVAVWRLVGAARGRLAAETGRLDGRARLVAGLDPDRTLGRGFSITRRESGGIVRDAAEAREGEILVTRLARGELRSRVEER
jgi:exodeoxyribonuclease VII large subunit